MHSIKIHKVIGLIVSLFYLIGFWHRGDKPTVKEIRLKFFYCIYYSLCVVSVVVGAITNEKSDRSIFSAETSIGTVVCGIKYWFSLLKQHQILNLLDRVCVFTIRNDDDYELFNEKLERFFKFVLAFAGIVAVSGISATVVLSFLGTEKTLFMEIGFPLDYRNNEFSFWIATTFLFTGFLFSTIGIAFNVIIWYLLLTCSLRFKVLGNELKIMGRRSETRNSKPNEIQMHNYFFKDLKESVDSHIHVTELTNEQESFFAELFFIQFSTSGLCICGSIYCLAFNVGDTVLEDFMYLLVAFYYIAELLMITYMGNEIMLSRHRLSYSLFESDWYNQPQFTKKNVIIFGEYLKQPKQLLVGKLYPLTLETFTRILNSAWSMFNILKNFRQ